MSAKRNAELDLIRVVAIAFVVLNHTVEKVFRLNITDIICMPLLLQFTAFIGFTIGRIGVPLFLFLSGFLLLNREYDNNSAIYFYKHNFLPLFLTWELWILLYNIFLSVFNGVPFSFLNYILRALLLSRIGIMHEWYMPMILGVYLFIPYLSIALHKMSNRTIAILLSVVYTHFFLVRYGSMVAEKLALVDIPVAPQLNLNFSGGEYGFYLIIGYFISKNHEQIMRVVNAKRIYLAILSGVLLVLIAFTVCVQVAARYVNIDYNVWYDFPTVPIIAVCVFLLLLNSQIKSERFKALLRVLSTSSFGVYLVHVPILLLINRFIIADSGIHPVMKLYCLTIDVLFLSFLTVYVSTKTKYLKRIFLI